MKNCVQDRAGMNPISAQIRMRLCKEKGRHSREGGNPVFLLFLVKSTGNELDPRFRGGDENPNLATNKFNNLRPYLSAYGDEPSLRSGSR